MTKVKGLAVASIPVFIKTKFGEDAFKRWLDVLSPEAKKVYETDILVSQWHPVKEMIVDPTIKIAELFYAGDIEKAAHESGYFSAEHALKGVYKIFVKLGSPQFIIKRGARLFQSFFDPSKLDVTDWGDKYVNMVISEFEGMSEVLEHRIMGWVKRAMEVNGCANVIVTLPQSMLKGDKVSEINIKWD